MSRPTLSEFKKKALVKAAVKKEYDTLSSALSRANTSITVINQLFK